MKKMIGIGIIDELERLVEDKRQGEPSIPLKLPHILAITAKMKVETKCGVDVYIPLRKNMNAYDEVVGIAKMPETKWNNYPNKK